MRSHARDAAQEQRCAAAPPLAAPLTAVCRWRCYSVEPSRPGRLQAGHGQGPLETQLPTRTERWNSYSRIVAYPPVATLPISLGGIAAIAEENLAVPQALAEHRWQAGTAMHHFDGTRVDRLPAHDIVNLAYHLPGIQSPR